MEFFKKVFLAAALVVTSACAAAQWRNLSEECHLGGRRASSGYLRGKAVMVYRWRASSSASSAMLPRIEQIWQSFKTKPFVVIGSHTGGDDGGARSAINENQISFPIYRDAGITENEPFSEKLPFIYVVDGSGKVVYRGRDERTATQACVMAIADSESPRNLSQWRRFLEYELDNLPGRAYLRVLDFRKAFPVESREYDGRARELADIPQVKRLAELVKCARELKDCGLATPADRRRHSEKIAAAIRRYSSLVSHPDPRVVQEAKNSIADLKWTQAAL